MKNHINIFLFFFLFFNLEIKSIAQTWLQSAGGNSQDEALAIAIDGQSNIVSTGYFSQSARFDNFIIGSDGMGDVFVSKQNANGDYLWVTKAGGLYSDRAFGIITDQNNNIYITGVFKGTAEFGTTTLTSNNNSQDAFVAKLDANGNFIWAISLGGNDTETANGIDVNSNGEVIIAGQYKGTAQFGSFNLTSEVYNSMMVSLAGLPSYDGFLVKINPTGNVLWAKNISAEYDDRAMKVVFDSNNQIYVSGQFSDTLNTGSNYNNNSYNAAFLLKTDVNGNDIWLRRILAPQIMIYDIKTNGTDVFLTGDAKGNININTSPSTIVSANQGDFNIYVLKMNQNGNLVWSATQFSENRLSSRTIALAPNGDVSIGGTYHCSFTQLTSVLQPALFNSVGYKDVFILNYNAQGAKIWEKNYGGIYDDWIWGMEMMSNNQPVIAGSFKESFSMPFGNNFVFHPTIEDLSSIHANANLTICGNSNYEKYVNAIGMGNKDILSAQPIDLSLPHFDYYKRANNSCLLDALMPQLFPLMDTVTACDSAQLCIRTNTTVDNKSAPIWEFLWSNNSDNDTITVNTSGWYFVEYGFADDCRRFKDSIYVEIFPSPFQPIVISTNYPIEIAIPNDGCFNKLAKMINDTAFLSATNLYPGYDFHWVDPLGNILTDTNIMAVDFGVYSLVIVSPNGMCSNSSCVKVYDFMDATCSNPSVMVPMLVFTDSNFNDTDTVIVCYEDFFGVELFDSMDFINNTSTNLNTFVRWTIIQGGFTMQFSNSAMYTFGIHHQEFKALNSGICILQAEILDPFTMQTIGMANRNFYLNVRQAPPNVPIIIGPIDFCPGDTALLSVSGGDEYSWSCPGILSVNSPVNDSIYIIMEGNYTLHSTTSDSILDCPDEKVIEYLVSAPMAPPVVMFPSHGVICPNDSVLLSAQVGNGYAWYGPTGSVLSTSSSVWVTVPGFYYYTFFTPGGCELISDMTEVKEYSTPFLEADPGTNLCIGGSLTVTVESNEMSLVNWMAPLSGNAFTQTISTPGNYQASVSFCNITTVVDIIITQSVLNAEIVYNGNDTICMNEEIILVTDAVGAAINWLPDYSSGSVYIPTEPGTYILELSDESGCLDYDTLILNYFPAVNNPIVQDTLICGGTNLILTANSTNNLIWYDDFYFGNIIGNGDSLNVNIGGRDTIFYVASFNGNCYSDLALVNVNLHTSSVQPNIYGDSILCLYDSLILFTDSLIGLNYQWSGPNNFSDSVQSISISSMDLNQSGIYSLYVYDSLCTSESTMINIQLSMPQLQGFALDSFNLCFSDTLFLSDTLIGNYTWQDGSTMDTFNVNTTGNYFFIFENNFGCIAYSDTVVVNSVTLPTVSSASDTAVCFGSPLILVSNSNGGIVHWTDDENNFSIDSDTLNLVEVIQPMTILISAINSSGCQSSLDTILISVLPNEAAPMISNNDTICEGEDLSLSASSLTGTQFYWNGPNGYISNSPNDTIFDINLNQWGIYSVYTTNGYCYSDTAEIDIFVYPLPTIEIVGDSILCFSDSVLLSVYSSDPFYWNDLDTSVDRIIKPDFSQWYYVTTEHYCGIFYDSIFVTVHSLPIIELGANQTVLLGLGVEVGVQDDLNYSWFPTNGLNCNNCSTVYASPEEETEYFLSVVDENGCTANDSITIFVFNESTCFIPNSFTPNSDGVNDVFLPQIYGIENYSLMVFNRDGEKIFQSSDALIGWDGTFKGEISQDGTYVYLVSGIDLHGETQEWRGHVNLLR